MSHNALTMRVFREWPDLLISSSPWLSAFSDVIKLVKRHRAMRTFDEILQSTSEILFPGELVEPKVSLDSTSIEGDTPLHVLLWQKDMEGVLALIAAGADVNAVGDMNETPLHIAVRQNMPRAAEALLAAGANPLIKSAFGETARQEALKHGGNLARVFKSFPLSMRLNPDSSAAG
jgi:uncharacterized protein